MDRLHDGCDGPATSIVIRTATEQSVRSALALLRQASSSWLAPPVGVVNSNIVVIWKQG